MIVGSGQFKYRVTADWAKLPDGWSFKEVGGVGVDRSDNVYVFNRGEHPMIVFDRRGNFLRSWGEGQYPRAHGVHMTQWTRDNTKEDHTASQSLKFAPDSPLEGDGFELTVPVSGDTPQ